MKKVVLLFIIALVSFIQTRAQEPATILGVTGGATKGYRMYIDQTIYGPFKTTLTTAPIRPGAIESRNESGLAVPYYWDGTVWKRIYTQGNNMKLEELDNVDTVGLAAGDILQFDGTTWINIPFTGGGGGGDGNNFTSGVTFATGTGVLSTTRSGLATITTNLDGRYTRYSDTAAMLTPYLRANAMQNFANTNLTFNNNHTHELANKSMYLRNASYLWFEMGGIRTTGQPISYFYGDNSSTYLAYQPALGTNSINSVTLDQNGSTLMSTKLSAIRGSIATDTTGVTGLASNNLNGSSYNFYLRSDSVSFQHSLSGQFGVMDFKLRNLPYSGTSTNDYMVVYDTVTRSLGYRGIPSGGGGGGSFYTADGLFTSNRLASLNGHWVNFGDNGAGYNYTQFNPGSLDIYYDDSQGAPLNQYYTDASFSKTGLTLNIAQSGNTGSTWTESNINLGVNTLIDVGGKLEMYAPQILMGLPVRAGNSLVHIDPFTNILTRSDSIVISSGQAFTVGGYNGINSFGTAQYYYDGGLAFRLNGNNPTGSVTNGFFSNPFQTSINQRFDSSTFHTISQGEFRADSSYYETNLVGAVTGSSESFLKMEQSGLRKYFTMGYNPTRDVTANSSQLVFDDNGMRMGIRTGYQYATTPSIAGFAIGTDSRAYLTGLVNTTIDTTTRKPVVMGPGGVLEQSFWFGGGGSGTDNTYANANLTATADRTHNWGGFFYHQNNVSDYEIVSTTSNGGLRYSKFRDAKPFYAGLEMFSQYNNNNSALIGAYNANDASSVYLTVIRPDASSTIAVNPQNISLQPHFGNLYIDTLKVSSGATQYMVTYDTVTRKVGYQAINALTATNVTTGTDVLLSYSGNNFTLAVPDASATARGVVSTGAQQFNGVKSFNSTPILINSPATSAGGYEFITRNTTTGAFEKIPSGSQDIYFTWPLRIQNTNEVYAPNASATADGWLDSLDWSHFNEAYNKYVVSGSYSAGTITFTRKDASTFTVTGLGGGGGSYTFVNSVTESGGTVQLVGDVLSPADNTVYGKTSTGRGWKPMAVMNLTSPTNGQILQYDAATTSWVNVDPSGGGGGVTSVDASVTASTALAVTGGPITTSGTLAFAWTGNNTQQVLGDGTLVTRITNNNQLTNGNNYITSANVAFTNTTNTFGSLQTFTTGATRGAINLIGAAGDPSASSDGDIWHNTTAHDIKFNENGTVRTVANLDKAQTFTNKTIAFGSNTVSGTIAQFNTAVTDADLATLAGTETLTNKTISGASNTINNINGSNISSGTVASARLTSIKQKAGIKFAAPSASENQFIARVPAAVTIESVDVIAVGTSPSVTYAVHYGSTYGTSLGTIVASATVTATGTATLNVTSIPANSYIWIVTSASSGTITDFSVQLNYSQQ